jgi:hypothetical protein
MTLKIATLHVKLACKTGFMRLSPRMTEIVCRKTLQLQIDCSIARSPPVIRGSNFHEAALRCVTDLDFS